MTMLSGHSKSTIVEHWRHISPSANLAVLQEVIDNYLKKHMVDFLMILSETVIHAEIRSNPKFTPFSDDCIRIIDSNHRYLHKWNKMNDWPYELEDFISECVGCGLLSLHFSLHSLDGKSQFMMRNIKNTTTKGLR